MVNNLYHDILYDSNLQVFQGNSDADNTVEQTLLNAAEARYVRFYPVTFSLYPCMRVEVFAALDTTAVCTAVGVNDPNRIPDAQMSSRSHYLEYHPYNGRLNGETGWCQGTSTISDDYLQVDMGTIRTVCAVATQGKEGPSYVTSYRLSLSTNGVNWSTYQDENAEEVYICKKKIRLQHRPVYLHRLDVSVSIDNSTY